MVTTTILLKMNIITVLRWIHMMLLGRCVSELLVVHEVLRRRVQLHTIAIDYILCWGWITWSIVRSSLTIEIGECCSSLANLSIEHLVL